MTALFITDGRAQFDKREGDRILFQDGLVGDCSFITKSELQAFNDSVIGFENEANRLMLLQLDRDIKAIAEQGLKFDANRFISRLDLKEKVHSVLYGFHRHFVVNKYLFQLVIDRFLSTFAMAGRPLILSLSEHYFLTQELPYNIQFASYERAYKNVYPTFLLKQVYYFLKKWTGANQTLRKTNIAIFLFDIPNAFDLFKTFVELVHAQDKIKLTFVVIDSGNAQDKTIDTSIYEKGNINVINLNSQKKPFFSDYSSFYKACKKLNPLYSIYKKARLCEMQDTQYGFMDNVISGIRPDVCIYGMTHEYGRVLSNVCSSYSIPTICIDYASLFDSYVTEKRIKFDVRASMSEVSSHNWIKHKDPSPRQEIIGFCKIDEWRKKLDEKEAATGKKLFDNDNKTILFISTYHPDPNSPLLVEKVRVVEDLSNACHRNGWNLLIKKHPAEFETLADDVLAKNQYPGQQIYQHHELSLFDSIYHADFVCTQNSTAYVEVLYLNKPFSYVTINGENFWAGLSYFSKEKEVHTFGSVAEYEQYITANADAVAYQMLQADFKKLQTKYLYKTDGKASERLLSLARSFIK